MQKIISDQFTPLNPTIGIIISTFNEAITQRLQQGAVERLQEQGVTVSSEHIFWVPGAIEIPVVAACLAQKKIYDAFICLGAVIKGETDHYEYVCWQVSYGCQKVAIEYTVPVIFGILTTENEQQAYARSAEGKNNKGAECADAALHMIALCMKLKTKNNLYHNSCTQDTVQK